MEVDISGAKVFFTIPIDFPLFGKIQISETLVVSWIVMALITGLWKPQTNLSSATWEKNSAI